jgi:hypothetical protein
MELSTDVASSCQGIPDADDRFVISPRVDFISARGVVKKDEDIVKPSWILRCVESGVRERILAE